MRLVVLPELGGKIYSLEYRPKSHEWLWQNPRISPQSVGFGSVFDDQWSGGIDVLFPSCYASHWNGESVPDSGEWWSIPWRYRIEQMEDAASVELFAGGRIWPVEAHRTISLEAGSQVVTLGVSLINVGSATLPFLLGFHPALHIEPGYRIDLPSGQGTVGESSGPGLGKPGQEYEWPLLSIPSASRNGVRDMRSVPGPEAGVYGGHYFKPANGELWWALTDTERSIGLGMAAPASDFQGLWMWQVYGGWRGYYHLALEPWTAFPITLHEAVEQGTANWLPPGETFSTEIKLISYSGVKAVRRVTAEGIEH
jgi:galactose mutarotase-like enzyme